MHARREFEPDPEVLSAVRAFVMEAAGVDRLHPAVLVANELAANAVLHARTRFTVRVWTNPVIHVEVRDPLRKCISRDAKG